MLENEDISDSEILAQIEEISRNKTLNEYEKRIEVQDTRTCGKCNEKLVRSSNPGYYICSSGCGIMVPADIDDVSIRSRTGGTMIYMLTQSSESTVRTDLRFEIERVIKNLPSDNKIRLIPEEKLSPIIDQVVSYYNNIQTYFVKRGSIKQSIIIHLFNYCIDRAKRGKESQIADESVTDPANSSVLSVIDPDLAAISLADIQMMYPGLTPDQMFSGLKSLNEINSCGVIRLPDLQDRSLPDSSITLRKYFDALNEPKKESKGVSIKKMEDKSGIVLIPEMYFTTLLGMLEYIIRTRLYENVVMNTQCVGVIYILTRIIPAIKIPDAVIAERCKISRNTFIRYYNHIVRFIPELRSVDRRQRSGSGTDPDIQLDPDKIREVETAMSGFVAGLRAIESRSKLPPSSEK